MENWCSLYLTAQARAQAGDGEEAGRLLQQALGEAPDEPQAWMALAQGLEAVGRYAQAHTAYQRLVQGGKAPLQVALGLARCLLGQGRVEPARRLFRSIVQADPRQVEALVGLAHCALERGELNEADKLLEEAFKLDPQHTLARYAQARLLLARHRVDSALAVLEQNLDCPDPHAASLTLWCKTLTDQKRILYLRDHLLALSQKYPACPGFAANLGVAYGLLGEAQNARRWLRQAHSMRPGDAAILYQLAQAERIAGELQEAQALFARLLEQQPDHLPAHSAFGREHRYSYGDPYFVRLNGLAADLASLPEQDQIVLHFALGKAFEDAGELATAFRHYALGGKKKLNASPYDEHEMREMFAKLKAHVTCASLQGQAGYADETPVFIVGMPRSGTTLTEQVLASHLEIYGAGELKYLPSALENIQCAGGRLCGLSEWGVFAFDLNASYAQRGKWYVDTLRGLAPGAYQRIVDKLPGNFLYVGLICAILPKARIIHCRRHPVATCLSCYRLLFREGHLYSYDLAALGRYYRAYWDLMQHWRSEFPGRMYELYYEALVADLEGQARALIDYLGLAWDENCLSFYRTDRPVQTASLTQVRKPIYTSSVNRWRTYQPYLQPLLDELGELVAQYEAEIAHLNLPDA